MTVASLYIIIVTIAVVLAFWMPFFIFKIRNQVVDMNEKMSRIIQLLETRAPATENSTVNVSPEAETFTEKYKRKQAEDDAIAQLAKAQKKELKAKEVSLWK